MSRYVYDVLQQDSESFAVIYRNVYEDDGCWTIYAEGLGRAVAREIAEALTAKENGR